VWQWCISVSETEELGALKKTNLIANSTHVWDFTFEGSKTLSSGKTTI
jgi:hypothetical protein